MVPRRVPFFFHLHDFVNDEFYATQTVPEISSSKVSDRYAFRMSMAAEAMSAEARINASSLKSKRG